MGAAASQSVDQAQDLYEVEDFLKHLRLQFYTDRVLDAGFETVDSLKALEGRDLAAMGFAPTHAERLLTKLGKRAVFPLAPARAPPVDTAPPLDGAAALAQAKLEMPCDGSNEVVQFLTQNGLAMHVDAMLRSGFDDMEVLMLIEDDDMRDIGLPRGHVLKLRRKLRELEASASTDASFKTSQPARAVSSSSSASTSASSSQGAPIVSPRPTKAPTLPVFGGSIPMVRTSWNVITNDIGTHVMASHLFSKLIVKAPLCLKLFGDESDDTRPMVLLAWLENFVKNIGATVCDEIEHDTLMQTLSRMGAARVATDVTQEHWQVLGTVLDLTLSESLGDVYTQDVRDAWMSAYQYMSSIIIDSMCTAKSVAAKMSAHIAKAQVGAHQSDDFGAQHDFFLQAARFGA